jgi:hypothetical protein
LAVAPTWLRWSFFWHVNWFTDSCGRFRSLLGGIHKPGMTLWYLNPYRRSRVLQFEVHWGGRTINDQIEMTDEAPKTRTTTWKRRLSIVCYLTAVSVAMVGWLSAFAWLTVAIAKWLLP